MKWFLLLNAQVGIAMNRDWQIKEPANEHFEENIKEVQSHIRWLKKLPASEMRDARVRVMEKIWENRNVVFG